MTRVAATLERDPWIAEAMVRRGLPDTLVIEVTGQLDRTWFDRAGNHHSAYMKVIERYTPTSAYTLRYDVRIEDEVTFTRPWEMSMTLYRRVGRDAQLHQFKCVEFVEELLYGELRKQAD